MSQQNPELPLDHHILTDRDIAIKLVGVGGGGSNAVDRLKMDNLDRIQLAVINTDFQALSSSPVQEKLLIGAGITRGLGAGGDPELGRDDRGFEGLVRRHHQHVKDRLLPVAEKKIFADARFERRSALFTDGHRVRRFVVDALIFDAERVEKIVAADLLRDAPRAVGGPSGTKLHKNISNLFNTAKNSTFRRALQGSALLSPGRALII